MSILRRLFGLPPSPPPPPLEREKSEAEERMEREIAAIQAPKERFKVAIDRAAPASAIRVASQQR